MDLGGCHHLLPFCIEASLWGGNHPTHCLTLGSPGEVCDLDWLIFVRLVQEEFDHAY